MILEICHSCGAKIPPSLTGASHAYLDASPGCWARFNDVLAREYSDFRYFAVHSLTVDAYAAQHPGAESRQTIRSINFHLLSLYAYYYGHRELYELSQLKQQLATLKQQFQWPTIPGDFGELTINDIWATETEQQHREAVSLWGKSVLDCWYDYHPYLRDILSMVTH